MQAEGQNNLKQANESGLQSCDAICLRFDDHGKSYTGGIYPRTKGKASRAPQTGNLIVGISSSETLDVQKKQPSNMNQPHSLIGEINHKRHFPVESSISHLSQWVGQRPRKNSRTRRANGVSTPVYNCDEMPMPFEGCSPSSNTTMTSTTSSGLASKGAISNIQFTKNKKAGNSFATRISERVEFGARENGQSKLKEKELNGNKDDGRAINDSCNIGSLRIKRRKKEINLNKEETGDGLQCSGKNGISSTEHKSEAKELSSMVDMVDQPHNNSFLPPLYQRVLTALIIDDQTEETVGDENISFLYERDDPSVTCDGMSMNEKLLMELRSVGIYPEPMPKLADGGCEAIDQEIAQSRKGGCQQLIKKKGNLLLDDVGASASFGGDKEKVLLEDVGASATLGNPFLGGTKRKRSKRGTNKDTSKRNYVNTRSECKTKAKAKPKTDELSTSAKGSLGKSVENTNSKHYLACGSDQLNNVGSVSHDYITNDFAIETEDPLDLTNMPELDSIEVGADKDLDSWLDIDVDALEDDDDAVGLDIPMDDLFTVL